jgi:hypothetical protein
MVLLVPGEGPLSQVTGHLPNVQLGRIHSGIFCRCIRRLPRRPLRSHDAISERRVPGGGCRTQHFRVGSLAVPVRVRA